MTVKTEISLKGEDEMRETHEIILADHPDNHDWFTIKSKINADESYGHISLPKCFISHLTKALEKIQY